MNATRALILGLAAWSLPVVVAMFYLTVAMADFGLHMLILGAIAGSPIAWFALAILHDRASDREYDREWSIRLRLGIDR